MYRVERENKAIKQQEKGGLEFYFLFFIKDARTKSVSEVTACENQPSDSSVERTQRKQVLPIFLFAFLLPVEVLRLRVPVRLRTNLLCYLYSNSRDVVYTWIIFNSDYMTSQT
jgi:hypothetical protein